MAEQTPIAIEVTGDMCGSVVAACNVMSFVAMHPQICSMYWVWEQQLLKPDAEGPESPLHLRDELKEMVNHLIREHMHHEPVQSMN